MNHEQFQEMLDKLAGDAGVGQEVLGEVLARISLRAPAETSRVEISAANPAARRPVDQRAIPQGTVSKAVKALKDEGLLEDGEKLLLTPDGRALAPLRLGSRYAIAGVKIVQSSEQPRQVTTALLGLDGSRVLGPPTHGAVDSWDQVAELIHQHVISLKRACDRDRGARGLEPLQMFGVGVEVGSPVHNGEVIPHLSDGAKLPVGLAAALRRVFDADASFGRPVSVVVENDVNALAVLAIHQVHYAEPDLVVVGVFDEGVGGGLVMDGRYAEEATAGPWKSAISPSASPPARRRSHRTPGSQRCPVSTRAAPAATSGMSTRSRRPAAFRGCSAGLPWIS